jgi:soluble lytic murein transglycosylase
VPSYRVTARYHYARALERLGKSCEAEAEYTRVQSSYRGEGAYYAMWSGLRLGSLRSQPQHSCAAQAAPERAAQEPPAPNADAEVLSSAESGASAAQPATVATLEALDAGFGALDPNVLAKAISGAPELVSGVAEGPALAHETQLLAKATNNDAGEARGPSGARPTFAADANGSGSAPQDAAARKQRALALLAPVAAEFGDAYPWLPRAQDLIELDLTLEAADELSEAYLAWRDVMGALRMRSGLLALLTGSAPPRRSVTMAVAKARRALDPHARAVLGEVAKLVGEPGIGLRLTNDREDTLPRAYAEQVGRAARKYGLDPNLLFAVMRVESIYNRRIISNAGAIGLMQIMPSTGQRIAWQIGAKDYDTVRLLDPQLNLEFAAWYLASLLKRFDGRLPLAIASYNGGPHNVRLWLRSTPPKMPLDAFLERIPFGQTFHYVRRVLTYYAAYRAQQKLPMTRLSVELPQLVPDPLAF